MSDVQDRTREYAPCGVFASACAVTMMGRDCPGAIVTPPMGSGEIVNVGWVSGLGSNVPVRVVR